MIYDIFLFLIENHIYVEKYRNIYVYKYESIILIKFTEGFFFVKMLKKNRYNCLTAKMKRLISAIGF